MPLQSHVAKKADGNGAAVDMDILSSKCRSSLAVFLINQREFVHPTSSPAGPIGIVAALRQELSGLLALMQHGQCVHIGSREFWVGELDGSQVVLVLSRVGKVAAAATTATLASQFGTRAIVFTGAAGALSPQVAIGDVVVSTEFLQHDVDASPLFPRWEIPLTGIARFSADAALAEGLAGSARDVLADPSSLVGDTVMHAFGLAAPSVHIGLIISGDQFVSTEAESAALRSALPDALAVEMEGAAAAQVCHEWGIPFAAVRIISDRADDSASVDFPRFITEVESRYSVAIIRHWLGQASDYPGRACPEDPSRISSKQEREP